MFHSNIVDRNGILYYMIKKVYFTVIIKTRFISIYPFDKIVEIMYKLIEIK